MTDTDILIDATKNIPQAVAFLSAQQQADGIKVRVIAAMELVVGCCDSTELANLQAFLASIMVLPVTPKASQQAHRLMETYHLSHGLLIPDVLIAATALKRRLPLFTRNIRHFQMIPGLRVVVPY